MDRFTLESPLTYTQRDSREPFYMEDGEICENCGSPCENPVFVPGLKFHACDDCAVEASILIYAKENCETLNNAVKRAKSVNQVRLAMQLHSISCLACINKDKAVRKEIGAFQRQEREAA